VPHTLTDRTAIVASIPLFSHLRKRELTRLARSADEREHEQYEKLVVQGEPGDACFVITDGTAAVYRNGRKITDLAPGAVFGEMALIDGGERSATVVMTSRGAALRIERRAFDELLDGSPSVAKAVLRQLAQRLRTADRALYG
jgi:CRP-like cAMP-binding protein